MASDWPCTSKHLTHIFKCPMLPPSQGMPEAGVYTNHHVLAMHCISLVALTRCAAVLAAGHARGACLRQPPCSCNALHFTRRLDTLCCRSCCRACQRRVSTPTTMFLQCIAFHTPP